MGIDKSDSDILTIMMADNSDSLEDLEKYYLLIQNNPKIDCVFGDRWIKIQLKTIHYLKRY